MVPLMLLANSSMDAISVRPVLDEQRERWTSVQSSRLSTSVGVSTPYAPGGAKRLTRSRKRTRGKLFGLYLQPRCRSQSPTLLRSARITPLVCHQLRQSTDQPVHISVLTTRRNEDQHLWSLSEYFLTYRHPFEANLSRGTGQQDVEP